MSKPTASFAVSLASALRAAGISQAELAKRVGCSRAIISYYMTGSKLPRKGMLERINGALGGANLSPVRPILVEEAARDLGISDKAIRRGLRGGHLSLIGTAIPAANGKRHRYVFYPQKYREFVNANA